MVPLAELPSGVRFISALTLKRDEPLQGDQTERETSSFLEYFPLKGPLIWSEDELCRLLVSIETVL